MYAAIFPRKFLELVNLKKLKSGDSATRTKTNDFVVVPNTLTVVQLEKYILDKLDCLSEMRQCLSKPETQITKS